MGPFLRGHWACRLLGSYAAATIECPPIDERETDKKRKRLREKERKRERIWPADVLYL